MDKFVSILGVGFLYGAVKARMSLELLTGVFRGEDGFLLMVGICGAALFITGIIWVIESRKKAV